MCIPSQMHIRCCPTALLLMWAEHFDWVIADMYVCNNILVGLQTVKRYASPTPPAGVHRYVMSLFLQPAAIDVRLCLAAALTVASIGTHVLYFAGHGGFTVSHDCRCQFQDSAHASTRGGLQRGTV